MGKDELSYFSSVSYEAGAIVQAPVRSRMLPALVVKSESVSAVKAAIRKSAFALKRLRKQNASHLLSPAFVRAAARAAEHHATLTGAVLFSYLPRALLGDTKPLPPTMHKKRTSGVAPVAPRVFQAPYDTRVETYRSLAREAFARKESALILAPTIAEAERLYEAVRSGITDYVYLLDGDTKPAELRVRWRDALSEPHPVLIVATPSFLSIPRHDLGIIIVERDASLLYKSRTRPFTDTRVLALHLAAELHAQLLLADLPLPIETYHRRASGEYEELMTGHQRTTWSTNAHIVSMRTETTGERVPFTALGARLTERLRMVGLTRGRAVLYVARRGLSPITVCKDCGRTVSCQECDASVVLHTGKEENYFLCHACGALRHARERCAGCSSWRLESLGIGTELVARELPKAAPDLVVHTLTGDTAKRHRDALRIVHAWEDTPGSVLIGTEMALPYLAPGSADLAAVVSLDTLLSTPSWSMYERIASILTRLRETAIRDFLVQTRRPETELLDLLLEGNFAQYYKGELATRRTFGYPPYTTIIKVSAEGKQQDVERLMEEARVFLLPFELVPFSRFLKGPRDTVMLHGFIRVKREEWPHKLLVEKLRMLPPSLTVSVDPESVV